MKKHDNVIIGIYKITNPKNEVYIGQTTNWIIRKTQYKNLHCKEQPKILKSLLEFGFENHQFEMIKEYLESELDEKESYHKQQYINQFSWGLALFCRIKDGRGGKCSEETKLKMSISMKGKNKGKKYSEETKQKMRKPKPKEFSNKMSKIHKGKTIPESTRLKMSIPVLQFDKQNNFIKEWESATKAITKLKITNICNCLNKRSKTAGGFVWKYK